MNQEENKTTESKYLKSYQHYADLYDHHTVRECRQIEKEIEYFTELKKKKKGKKFAPNFMTMVDEIKLYVIKGERYLNKRATIEKWMETDKKRDELFERAEGPDSVTCLTCGRLMYEISKDLWTDIDKPDRVLFMYECPLKHVPLRAFYDNGEERRITAEICSKCGSDMTSSAERSKDKLISVHTCNKCGHEERLEIDTTIKEEKVDEDFAKDRDRFCMTEEEGSKYMDAKYKLRDINKTFAELAQKEKNKAVYDKVAKIQKLKIVGVEELLSPVLEANNFIRLKLDAPTISKDVIVGFSVHDSKDRTETQSQGELKKVMRKALEGTNWRLMSDGVDYRLGMLTGRLRGYERDDDMLELVQDTNNSEHEGGVK
jgi:Zn ribbon nucleic-acid-binding protein